MIPRFERQTLVQRLPSLVIMASFAVVSSCVSEPPGESIPPAVAAQCGGSPPTDILVTDPALQAEYKNAATTTSLSIGSKTQSLASISQKMRDTQLLGWEYCVFVAMQHPSCEQAKHVHDFNEFLLGGPTASEIAGWQAKNPYPAGGVPCGTSGVTPTSPIDNWERFDVHGPTGTIDTPIWTDIAWSDRDHGWLGGFLDEGGAGGDVGHGILLSTEDGGAEWSVVPAAAFDSGKGKFCWGFCPGSYQYTWSEVGPVKALSFYKPVGSNGPVGFLAAATGIYRMDDTSGLPDQSWKRMTPIPDAPEYFAFFANIATIEGTHQIYASGWQGIAHWPDETGHWQVEMSSLQYLINAVFIGPAREVWAAGDAPYAGGNVYQPGLYYKAPDSMQWSQIDLTDLSFPKDAHLRDITILNPPSGEIAVAVGTGGLIIRGVLSGDSKWSWKEILSPTDKALNSIAADGETLWAVGDQGVIIQSTDEGSTWETVDVDDGKADLRRIRFYGATGWILGNKVVLRRVPSD